MTCSGRVTSRPAMYPRSKRCHLPAAACRRAPTRSLQRAARHGRTVRPSTFCQKVSHTARRGRMTFDELFRSTHRENRERLHRIRISRRHAAVGLLSPNVAELILSLLAAEAVGHRRTGQPCIVTLSTSHLFGRAGIQVLIAAGPEIDPGIWATARRLGAELGITAVYALRPTDAVGQGPALDELPGVEVGYLCDIAARTSRRRPDRRGTGRRGPCRPVPHRRHHRSAEARCAQPRSEVADAWMIAANSLLDNDSRALRCPPAVPRQRTGGDAARTLLRGQHVVWAGPLGYRDPELVSNLWKLVERYGIATMSGVPTVYSMLATSPLTRTSAALGSPSSALRHCRPRSARRSPRTPAWRCSRATGSPRGRARRRATCPATRGPVRWASACRTSG